MLCLFPQSTRPTISDQQIWLLAIGVIAVDLLLAIVPVVPFVAAYVLVARANSKTLSTTCTTAHEGLRTTRRTSGAGTTRCDSYHVETSSSAPCASIDALLFHPCCLLTHFPLTRDGLVRDTFDLPLLRVLLLMLRLGLLLPFTALGQDPPGADAASVSLGEALQKHSHLLRVDDGSLRGDGGEWLQERAEEATVISLGESHGPPEIPAIMSALPNDLQSASDVDHLGARSESLDGDPHGSDQSPRCRSRRSIV